MLRTLLCSSLLVIALMATGCCGPMGCGVGCNAIDANCYDCDGTYQPGIIMSPLDGIRNIRRSMVCGGGCGEAYYGEWRSTPPDAYDPCCGDEFVGGAFPCRPFCWQPGTLLNAFYGQRFAQPGCYDDVCTDGCCGDCGDGEVIESGPSCSGCASCNAAGSGTRMTSRSARSTPMRTARRIGTAQNDPRMRR